MRRNTTNKVSATSQRQVIKMKQEEIKAMVEETSGFVNDVVRKVPSNQSEELNYMMTMAVLFHEIAHRQPRVSSPINGNNTTSAVT